METIVKKTTGQRIQLLRLERNMTQEEMSEKLNLSTSAYCKIEYGETDLTLTRLTKIAEILNMTTMELFSKIAGNGNSNDLRELIKANSRLIEALYRRVEMLESALKIP